MPKIKTHRASAKRFSLTKNGKVKRGQAYSTLILVQCSKNHGIGTKNIRHVVEKYHGEYRIQIQDGQFQTQILLPLKDEA